MTVSFNFSSIPNNCSDINYYPMLTNGSAIPKFMSLNNGLRALFVTS